MKKKLTLVVILLFSINCIFAQVKDSQFIKNLSYGWVDIVVNQTILPQSEPNIKNNLLKKQFVNKQFTNLDYTIYKSDYNPEINVKLPININLNEDASFETSVEKIEFYGTNLIFEIDKNIKIQNIKDISQTNISTYWDNMAKSNYSNFLLQLLDFKKMLNLSDWGYYMLISKVAQNFYADNQNSANLFTWFFMLKSGFNTRLSFDNQNISLLIASSNTIYNLPFYQQDGIRYYSVSKTKTENLKTYYGNYNEANNLVSLSINSPINLTEKIVTKNYSFLYKDSTFNITIDYNQNLINFYKDYPTTDLNVYFNAAVSSTTKNSLLNSLNQLISSKSEKDKVDFI